MDKILVVDEGKNIQHLFVNLLSRAGCRVLTTDRGSEALKIVKSEQPKVVILDIKKPGMNGTEVLRKVREENSRARVIIVTAYPSFEVFKKVEDLDVDKIILKPFNFARTVRTIRETLLNYDRREDGRTACMRFSKDKE